MTPCQDPRHPAMPLLTPWPLAAFAPQDAQALGPLRHVMRRFHALDVQQHPQRLSCPLEAPGTRPGFVLPRGVLVQQLLATGIPGPPLAHRGPRWAPMTQPWERGVSTCATARQACLYPCRAPLSRAEQIRPATLSEPLPVRRDAIPSADQHARPVRHEVRPCSCGVVGVYLAGGDVRLRHAPQPAPLPTGEPRGLGHGVDAGDQLRDRPLAQRYPDPGGTPVLPGTAACSHDAHPRPHAAGAPRAIATDGVGRAGRLAERAAGWARPLVPQPGRHVGMHDWQCQNRMGVLGAQLHTLPRATDTCLGAKRDGGSGFPQDLRRAGRTTVAARLSARGGWPASLVLGRRRIGRRWPAGVGGVRGPARCKSCQAFKEGKPHQTPTHRGLVPSCSG